MFDISLHAFPARSVLSVLFQIVGAPGMDATTRAALRTIAKVGPFFAEFTFPCRSRIREVAGDFLSAPRSPFRVLLYFSAAETSEVALLKCHPVSKIVWCRNLFAVGPSSVSSFRRCASRELNMPPSSASSLAFSIRQDCGVKVRQHPGGPHGVHGGIQVAVEGAGEA